MKFAAQVCNRIFRQWNAWISTLLRAVVHQAVFANVEIAPASAATPLVRLPQGNIVLKRIDARKAAFLQALHLVIHPALFVIQRLHLSSAIVNDSNRRAE